MTCGGGTKSVGRMLTDMVFGVDVVQRCTLAVTLDLIIILLLIKR